MAQKRPLLFLGEGWVRVERLVLLFLALSWPAGAQVTILTAGAYHDEAARIVQSRGVYATITTDTAGGGLRRLRAGERFDLVINTPAGITALIAEGKLSPPLTDVARIGIGIAIRTGTPIPAIDNEAAFRALVQTAPSIAMIDPAAGGSSGIYLFKLFESWGIVEEIKPKLVLVQSGRAADRVASGAAAIALQQLTELNVAGVTIVGPLPASIQSYTTYSGAVSPTAPPRASELLNGMALNTDLVPSVPTPAGKP